MTINLVFASMYALIPTGEKAGKWAEIDDLDLANISSATKEN
jgi:hypothetical protein